MQNDVPKEGAKPMVADLKRRLVEFYGVYAPEPLRARFLLAAAEPLIAPQDDPCGEL